MKGSITERYDFVCDEVQRRKGLPWIYTRVVGSPLEDSQIIHCLMYTLWRYAESFHPEIADSVRKSMEGLAYGWYSQTCLDFDNLSKQSFCLLNLDAVQEAYKRPHRLLCVGQRALRVKRSEDRLYLRGFFRVTEKMCTGKDDGRWISKDALTRTLSSFLPWPMQYVAEASEMELDLAKLFDTSGPIPPIPCPEGEVERGEESDCQLPPESDPENSPPPPVKKRQIEKVVVAKSKRNLPEHLYLIGGTGGVSQETRDYLKSVNMNNLVTRRIFLYKRIQNGELESMLGQLSFKTREDWCGEEAVMNFLPMVCSDPKSLAQWYIGMENTLLRARISCLDLRELYCILERIGSKIEGEEKAEECIERIVRIQEARLERFMEGFIANTEYILTNDSNIQLVISLRATQKKLRDNFGDFE